MITSEELIRLKWPKGKVFGLALRMAERMAAEGVADELVLGRLAEILQDPARFLGTEGEPGELAKGLLGRQQWIEDRPQLRDEPMEAPVWGRHMIDPGAITQLQNAMQLPVTAAGALMPDAHIGYGIPIGGVVALEDAVAPYMVGVDIACRMMMSIYPTSFLNDFQTNVNVQDLVRRALVSETRFGMGAAFRKGEERQHDVMDDPDWGATKFLRHLRDKAYSQLGTSGTGNHFVDVGVVNLSADGAAEFDLEAGEYLAVMSHSGSRGTGAKICDRYSKIAQKLTPLPGPHRHLAWLPIHSEEGEEYWTSMNLAGRYASANHHAIHRALAKAFGERPLAQVENHHNFAWLEEHGGKKLYVHRKGATPAAEGEIGIVPGSMGHDSFIVRGKGNPASLNSASHGAGRTMSRRQAISTLPKAERNAWLEERGIELIGGGMDEAPMAYKDIEEVLAQQSDLLEPIARFTPRMVIMADDGKTEG